MLSLFAILVVAQTTVKDGIFADPAVWSSPLSRNSDVRISHQVFLDNSIEVRTITVAPEGSLTIADPLTVTFTDSPLDTAADPEQLGHGLLVYGKLRVIGSPVTAYVRSAGGELISGTSFIPLESVPNSWQPGQTLYVPDTRQPDHQFNPAGSMPGVKPLQHEFRTIRQVQKGGILLDRPLDYPHLGARDADGKLLYLPVIANLTRSIVFRSENPTGTRAHAFFNDRADVEITGASFLDMGRTTNQPIDDTKRDAKGNVLAVGKNQRGRYAVHFHHCMGLPPSMPPRDYQFRCVNNVIWSQAPASRWGITVHHSHYGLIQDNVIVTVGGSGIVTEDGNEAGNVFRGNYVANVTGESRPDARQNEIGFEGVAYWFRGGNNRVIGNHAYSCQIGYSHYARFAPKGFRYPSQPGGMEDHPPKSQEWPDGADPTRYPLLEWRGNECCASQNAFAPWWIGAYDRTPLESIGESVVRDQVSWHVRGPVSAYECGRFRYINMVSIGDKSKSTDSNGGWGASDYVQWRCSIEGGRIENYNGGIRVPAITDALDAYGTNPGLFVVRGTRIRCRTNVTVPIPWHNATANRLPPITVHVDNVNLQHLRATDRDERHIRMGYRAGEFSNYSQWVSVNFTQGPVHLRWFGPNQSPQSILPASTPDNRVIGAPVSGPNQSTWQLFGLAGGGEITPPKPIVTPDNDAVCVFATNAPYIRPVPDITLQPGQSWSYGVCAYDPTLGELEYSVKGPEGMAIENRSGRLNWTAKDAGTFPVTVTAKDVDRPASAARSFTVSVRMPSG